MSIVKHVACWNFEDGIKGPYTVKTAVSHLITPMPRGWYCWVYYYDTPWPFIDWMTEHCPSASCTPRFNSGDPMITVYIPNDEDAMRFKLTYL